MTTDTLTTAGATRSTSGERLGSGMAAVDCACRVMSTPAFGCGALCGLLCPSVLPAGINRIDAARQHPPMSLGLKARAENRAIMMCPFLLSDLQKLRRVAFSHRPTHAKPLGESSARGAVMSLA